ncbi:two-component system response regulator CreB [Uliginosibacterium sp. H3]|uniref:Two-component system response regulator CreB n=1 Tax=Uliginosibacterium silvisoli TaxID=3114758 RepID=A0ABU6JZC8_9RHOO|nr:two-component system response regulator CreB [Uliginosibacterium sp. H3]
MPSATILIVEDEPAIADTLSYSLRSEGYAPQWVATGEAALAAIGPDTALVILDVGLPDLSGFEVCRRLRARPASPPVMFLTAHSEEIDRVLGFEIGADDYVLKPFSPREVVARVRVILRRNGGNGNGHTSTTAVPEKLVLDEPGARVCWCGTPLPLTRFEYLLLRHLMRQPGRVFSREQLLDAVWGNERDSTDRTVDTHIKTLRAKLRAAAPEADPILTHRGMGYSFDKSPA